MTFIAALSSSASDSEPVAESTQSHSPSSIPWTEIGKAAGAQYSGDGLQMTRTGHGARLTCVFQRLEGEATPREGLWLASTVANQTKDRFRVTATAIGGRPLPQQGEVTIEGPTVRFTRPGLIEEYSVSMDGVRQDFVVLEKPGGASVPASRLASSLALPRDSELRVKLAVTGARVEQTVQGAQLVLASGRKIAYSRLRVMDANGKELKARIEVPSSSPLRTTLTSMVVVVDDSAAIYPIRIDPTFSDANWVSMGGILGIDGFAFAAVADASANLYVGGMFTIAGDVFATNIAKWNGSTWSALGTGIDGYVDALAVSGSDLYAGGYFATANGKSANNIAKWDGTSWNALDSGTDGTVRALVVSSGDLYAAGSFTTAGAVPANNIAKWNGSSWSALGSGMDGGLLFTAVYALASGSELYAGGNFKTAGGVSATNIARWNGTNWRAMGGGLDGGGENGVKPGVYALAVSGGSLYAGGEFATTGSASATNIAKWNGSSWSSLGSGVDRTVWALVISGSDLYAGGGFSTAGGISANMIAKWNGSSWSALGAGMSGGGFPYVLTLAFSEGKLYAGGEFKTAGLVNASRLAQWNGSNWSALGSGIAGDTPFVHTLVVSDGKLYVGGTFTTAGGVPTTNIAKWNGTAWSQLGSGLNNTVSTLAVSGGDLYAGGGFTGTGDNMTQLNHIGKWNGSGWSALGAGMNGWVSALAVSGNSLYAGGSFWTAGSVTVKTIAKWNGTNWSALV